MKKIKVKVSLIIATSLLLTLATIYTTLLFVLDTDKETNNVVVGYNDIEVEEEFNPPSELKQGENTYQKAVSVKNTGNTDAYVRVFVAFSSKEIEDISQVSGDSGVTYSSFSTFVPPEGWVKNNTDGFFYFEDPISPQESTPDLITNVKTTFANAEDVQQYEILVYAESVQAKDLNGETPNNYTYSAAWDEFLQRK